MIGVILGFFICCHCCSWCFWLIFAAVLLCLWCCRYVWMVKCHPNVRWHEGLTHCKHSQHIRQTHSKSKNQQRKCFQRTGRCWTQVGEACLRCVTCVSSVHVSLMDWSTAINEAQIEATTSTAKLCSALVSTGPLPLMFSIFARVSIICCVSSICSTLFYLAVLGMFAVCLFACAFLSCSVLSFLGHHRAAYAMTVLLFWGELFL